jgi:hypothetical protein
MREDHKFKEEVICLLNRILEQTKHQITMSQITDLLKPAIADLATITADIKALTPGGSGTGGISASDLAAIQDVVNQVDVARIALDAIIAGQGTNPGNPPTGVPVISSAPSVTLAVNQPASFQVSASNTPTAFAATGLPAGLSIDVVTGLISGTPTVGGVTSVSVTASNASGASTIQTLVLTIA